MAMKPAARIFLVCVLVMAAVDFASAQDRASALPFCGEVKGLASRDADLHAAEVAAFGEDARFLPAQGAIEHPAPCEALAGFVHFGSTGALVTGHRAPDSAAFTLSAYVLRQSGRGYSRIAIDRDFGVSTVSQGGPGDLSTAHVGGEDVIVVTSAEGGLQSGSLFALRDGGITPLGTVPTGWDNVETTGDEKRQITIVGIIEKDQPQPGQLRVTYRRRSWDTVEDIRAVWRSANGNYGLVSGTMPTEMARDFHITPAPAFSKP